MTELSEAPLAYNLYSNGIVILVYLKGALRPDSEPVLDRCLSEVRKLKYDLVVLSLKSLKEVDETSVRGLRKFLHAIRQTGTLKVCEVSEPVRTLIDFHSLATKEEIGGRLIEVLGADMLRLILR